MAIKENVIKKYDELIEGQEKFLGRLKADLEVAKDMNFEQSNYKIKIRSREDVDISIETEHFGSINDAIKKAEEEYRVKNNNPQIFEKLTVYEVNLMIRGREFPIGEENWSDLSSRISKTK